MSPIVIDDAEMKLVDGDSQIGFNSRLNAPCIPMEFHFRLNERQFARVAPLIAERQFGALRKIVEHSGKSSHSQQGLFEEIDWETAQLLGDVLIVRGTVTSTRQEAWLGSVKQVIERETRLKAGKLLLHDNNPLNETEIGTTITRNDIVIEAGRTRIEKDTAYIPLVQGVEYRLQSTLVSRDAEREEMLKHGREGMTGAQDRHTTFPKTVLKPGEHYVGEINISPGPYHCVIQRQVAPGLEHCASVHLDPIRSCGMGIPNQVELVNTGKVPIDLTSVMIPVKFYPPSDAELRLWESLPLQARKRIHREGFTYNDVPGLISSENLRRWFSTIADNPSRGSADTGKNTAAAIVTRNGTTEITCDPQRSYKDYRTELELAATSGERVRSDVYEDLREVHGNISSNGRILVSHHLPSASHLLEMHNAGVTTFIFRGMDMDPGVFDGRDPQKPLGNHYMSEELHYRLLELSRRGCQFVWWPLGRDDADQPIDHEPRVFRGGVWVLSDSKTIDRFDDYCQNGVGFAMYGSSRERDELPPELTEEIQAGVASITRFDWGGQVAIIDGGGPGVMDAAHEAAIENGLLSIGVCLDLEQVKRVSFKGHSGKERDCIALFHNDAISYRQKFMGLLNQFPVLNPGGSGTVYEAALEMRDRALHLALPLPIWLPKTQADETQYWQALLEQYRVCCEELVGSKPLAKEWLIHMLQDCESYEEMIQRMHDFFSDPWKYWDMWGISEEMILRAIREHVKIRNLQGGRIRMPRLLREALESRLGEKLRAEGIAL